MAKKLDSMGKFTAVGMRTPVESLYALTVNTCAGNDTDVCGSLTQWTWANPTNRAIEHSYEDVWAVSVEALWQGTKVYDEGGEPDYDALSGDWRRGKGRRPLGAYAGEGRPLITDPGEARRRIYIPAYRRLVEHWMADRDVQRFVANARAFDGPVYLRDYDTGRGVDRRGPMSHAWVLAVYLNTGKWPE